MLVLRALHCEQESLHSISSPPYSSPSSEHSTWLSWTLANTPWLEQDLGSPEFSVVLRSLYKVGQVQAK